MFNLRSSQGGITSLRTRCMAGVLVASVGPATHPDTAWQPRRHCRFGPSTCAAWPPALWHSRPLQALARHLHCAQQPCQLALPSSAQPRLGRQHLPAQLLKLAGQLCHDVPVGGFGGEAGKAGGSQGAPQRCPHDFWASLLLGNVRLKPPEHSNQLRDTPVVGISAQRLAYKSPQQKPALRPAGCARTPAPTGTAPRPLSAGTSGRRCRRGGTPPPARAAPPGRRREAPVLPRAAGPGPLPGGAPAGSWALPPQPPRLLALTALPRVHCWSRFGSNRRLCCHSATFSCTHAALESCWGREPAAGGWRTAGRRLQG